jgi:hypothetical protein
MGMCMTIPPTAGSNRIAGATMVMGNTETTMSKSLRKPDGTFAPGHPGLGGRPIGSRNRLTEVALAALGDDFAVHGTAVIEEVRKTKPHVYLQVVASLLPRQVSIEKLSPLADLTDDEVEQLQEHLSAMRAKLVQQLERHNGIAIEPIQKSPTSSQREKP